jgi:hypothetical protein
MGSLGLNPRCHLQFVTFNLEPTAYGSHVWINMALSTH